MSMYIRDAKGNFIKIPVIKGDTIPDYINDEVARLARVVMSHQSADSFSIICSGDWHCNYYDDLTNRAQNHASKAMRLLEQTCDIDLNAMLGDYSTGAYNTTIESTITDTTLNAQLVADSAKILWMHGNHDDAPYQPTSDRLTKTQLYNLIARRNNKLNAVIDSSNPLGGYGYVDFENAKVRVIYLNTDDKQDWASADGYNVAGGEAPPYLNAHNLSATQLKFIAEKALDLSDYDKASDWSIIVLSHVALNVTGTYSDTDIESVTHSTANAGTIINAYKNASSGSITHNGETVDYDFSSLTDRAAIICSIHAHNHAYLDEIVGGSIQSIGVPNIMDGRERESSDGNTYTKTADTAEGTSFCVITIDKSAQKIYADHYGAGFDREYDYEIESIGYTNQIPISTDMDGSVYNTVGYKEGYRLSSSGAESAMDGMAVTGFIPCAYKDLVYLQNVGFTYGETTSGNQRISLYTADKTHLAQTTATALGGAMLGVKGDDNVWTQFQIPAAIDSTNTTVAAYFRLCGTSIDDTSIITVNEPIV